MTDKEAYLVLPSYVQGLEKMKERKRGKEQERENTSESLFTILLGIVMTCFFQDGKHGVTEHRRLKLPTTKQEAYSHEVIELQKHACLNM